MRKAHQRLYFLKKLRQAHLPRPLLTNFYTAFIGSILTYCCTAEDRKDLQRVTRAAERIIGTMLPSLRDIYTGRLHEKARNISTDPTHSGHALDTPWTRPILPSSLWRELPLPQIQNIKTDQQLLPSDCPRHHTTPHPPSHLQSDTETARTHTRLLSAALCT